MELFVAVADVPSLNDVVSVRLDRNESDSMRLSTLYAWRTAVLGGRLSEAAALRRYMETFDDELTVADAEWQ